ncbi:MAG: hypothetical protein ISEC1_P1807 [Thiomicrorhabdus sp.]|nr:MAG: hypothetical protein ISEC1_P1807 [Thiomicrorhabdus sp.]
MFFFSNFIGGIKLGAGRLTRSYGQAALVVLPSVQVEEMDSIRLFLILVLINRRLKS